MKLNEVCKNESYSVTDLFLIFLAAVCFSHALFLTVKYANQIPLDFDSFRQTQTALTAYWLVKNGFSFSYETPVAGIPWSIPFEFPVYQLIVAKIVQMTGFSLNQTGRMVSFLFLLLCLIPVRSITRNLNLSNAVFYIFTALLLSSPLYLYWGRAILIETAAIFFSVTAIKYFIDIIIGQPELSYKRTFLFLFFMTLGILQKITTGLPILAVLSLVYFFLSIKKSNSLRNVFLSEKVILALVYFAIPLAIGALWVLYTDQVKSLNSFGSSLTSSARTKWVWGTLNLRLHPFFYNDVLWRRGLGSNVPGLFAIMIALLSDTQRSTKLIIIISLLLWFLPLLLFTSLHVVHDYYQVANVIFLIYAVSVSLGQVIIHYRFKIKIIPLLLVILVLVSNYSSFYKSYFNIIKIKFNSNNSRDYAISEILKREIPQNKYFVAFGNNWSSTFSYFSERKSFTVPPYYKQYEKIAHNPEHFIEESKLGGVIVCYLPSPPISVLHQQLPVAHSPSIDVLTRWSSSNRRWKIGEVQGCYIAVPEADSIKTISKVSHSDCHGNIDQAEISLKGNIQILSISGWLAVSEENGVADEKIILIMNGNDEPKFLEALNVLGPSKHLHSDQSGLIGIGFSRILDVDSFEGKFTVGVGRLKRGHLRLCQFQEEMIIHNGNPKEKVLNSSAEVASSFNQSLN